MIEELLNKLLTKHISRIPASVTTGSIKDVDEDNYTCTVEREDRPTLYGVRLNAVEYTGNRLVVIPKTGSMVLVCMIESDIAEAYLLAYSEVSKVLIKIDTSEFEIKGGSIKGVVGVSSFEITGQKLEAAVGESSVEVTPVNVKASLGASSIELLPVAVNITGELMINGGLQGGLPMLTPLKDSLNSLKTYSESMKAAIATAFQQIPNGGSVASMNFNTAMSTKSIVISEMENQHAKQ